MHEILLQKALVDAALIGDVDIVKNRLEKVRQRMRGEDVKAMEHQVCMAVATKDAAGQDEDQRLQSVLEMLLDSNCAVTQPMLTACQAAQASSVTASRAAFLQERMNQVCCFDLHNTRDGNLQPLDCSSKGAMAGWLQTSLP